LFPLVFIADSLSFDIFHNRREKRAAGNTGCGRKEDGTRHIASDWTVRPSLSESGALGVVYMDSEKKLMSLRRKFRSREIGQNPTCCDREIEK
jgi:hypothetical protein